MWSRCEAPPKEVCKSGKLLQSNLIRFHLWRQDLNHWFTWFCWFLADPVDHIGQMPNNYFNPKIIPNWWIIITRCELLGCFWKFFYHISYTPEKKIIIYFLRLTILYNGQEKRWQPCHDSIHLDHSIPRNHNPINTVGLYSSIHLFFIWDIG